MIKRIRPAKHYQRADNPQRKLMAQYKRPLKRDVKSALGLLGEAVPKEKIERLLKEHRFRAIGDAIDFHHFREVMKGVFASYGKAYEAGAQLGVRKINSVHTRHGRKVRFRKAIGDRFNFDLYTEEVQARIRQAQDDLIAQLEDDVRDSIETIVLDGAGGGLEAADIVDDIRALIGLTDTQAQAVLNYRSMLESLDPTALKRQLRNTDHDQTVQDAIDTETDLAAAAIDEMVNDYVDNYLTYRAEMIAQTESSRAVNEGLHDAYSQAIERGALPDEAVRREWELGDSPCPICESIPDSNPDGVGVDEDFESDDGAVDDPPVHPNCMCSVNYITDVSALPDDEVEDDSGSYDTAAFQADEYR